MRANGTTTSGRAAAILGIAAALALGILGTGDAAHAAPWNVEATLEIEMVGTGFPVVTASGIGTVDLTGGTLSVPGGLVTLASATLPITGTTGIDSLAVSGLANLSGTFSLGGATSQAAGEVCASPSLGEACVAGGGLGGLMGLTGSIDVIVVPGLVTIPIGLDDTLLGRGGAQSIPWLADGAPWTTGTARVAHGPTGTNTLSTVGTNGAQGLTLVTTTYLNAGGNSLPLVGRLTFSSVPEPGAAGLLAAGALGLFWSLRHRRGSGRL